MRQHFSDHLAASPVSHTTTCVLDDGLISLTGPDLLARISQLSERLYSLVAPGDLVCVAMPSCVAYMVVQATLVDLGAVFISVPADAPHLSAVVADRSPPKWVVLAHDGALDRHPGMGDAGVITIHLTSGEVEVIRDPKSAQGISGGPESRVVVATSGSTGQAKLVNLSPAAYWHAASMIGTITSVDSTDRLLHHLPVQRGAGWLAWAGVAAGAHNLIIPTRSEELAEALRGTSTTTTFSVSVGLHALLVSDMDSESLPHLRTLYYSSGTVSVEVKRALVERYGRRLIQDYGMTEVPEPLTVLGRDDHVRGLQNAALLASVGRPLYSDRVRTSAPQGHRPSSILVRSPHMFDGYWGETPFAHGSWYETDDLGYIDEAGYLHLRGRRSKAVRSGGLSFSLAALESALRSIPGVDAVELTVVPDDRLGERVKAAVDVAASSISAESIRRRLRELTPDSRMAAVEITVKNSPISKHERNFTHER